MDDVDFQLLKELSENSRATYRELAEKLDLSANAVHSRVQSIVKTGIIKQFTICPTQKAIPHLWVCICGVSEAARINEMVERLGKNPLTFRVLVAGNNYIYVKGVLRDISEMNRYVNFVIREAKITNPVYGLLDTPPSKAASGDLLTNMDYRILASLQENSRKQIVDVATELGISAKTMRYRLKRMEKNGLVSYGLKYDPTASGYIFAAMSLFLKNGTDYGEVVSSITKKYEKNISFIYRFSTISNLLVVHVWTKTMAELSMLQSSLRDEGLFDRIVLNTPYEVYYFDTWLDMHIREKASSI